VQALPLLSGAFIFWRTLSMSEQHQPSTPLDHYHQHFDAELYNTLATLVASNLYTDREDARVVDALNLLIDGCLELCGSSAQSGAWLKLAVICGQNGIIRHVVDAMVRYLRRFSEDDPRIGDFEGTAKGMLCAYSAQDELRTAAAHANGVHSWQGRSAYELLVAADYLTQAAMQLLQQGDEAYLSEKLKYGINRLTGALYEGIRHSERPERFDFHSAYLPQVTDRW
jgi:hypothetical protein